MFLVLLALSALFLLYYLAPTAPPLFTEQQSPTSSTDVSELEVIQENMRFMLPKEIRVALDTGALPVAN